MLTTRCMTQAVYFSAGKDGFSDIKLEEVFFSKKMFLYIPHDNVFNYF